MRAQSTGFALVLTVFTTAIVPALAQETREAQILKQREAKAAQLQPYRRGGVEAALFKIEDSLLVTRIFNPPRGVFVRVGGLTEGAGFAAGPAFRLSNPRVSFTASGAYSLKSYWIGEATFSLPHLAGDHIFVELYGRRRDFPQEDFFGLGPQTAVAARTNFALRDTAVSVAGGVRAGPWTTLGARVEYLAPEIGRGTDPLFPSTDSVFTETDAPGLEAQPDFIRAETFFKLDYTGEPLRPRSGGRYTLSYNKYSDRDLDRFSFDRLDVDLQQYLPFNNKYRVLALRAFASSLTADSGQSVPFYLQPTLGGAYSLRGFRSYRFRDRHLLLLQAEYRWEINPFVTGALFYDAGKVAPRRSDLDFRDLERDYGIGLRVGSTAGIALRLDVAFGSGEGTRILLRFNNVF